MSNVSHELRTPVTVLRSSLEALCDGVVSDPQEMAEYHQSMFSETLHLQRMIGDFLELSRLQNPDYVMRFDPLDMAGAAEDALRAAKHMAKKKNITLTHSLQSDALIIGDYGRIRQLLITCRRLKCIGEENRQGTVNTYEKGISQSADAQLVKKAPDGLF